MHDGRGISATAIQEDPVSRRVRSPRRLRNRHWRTSRRRSLLVPDVIFGLHPVETAGPPAAAAESGGLSRTGTSRSGRASRRVRCRCRLSGRRAYCNAGLARGNPRRRLPDGSKGCLGVVVAVHDRPPHTEQDRSLRSAGAASRFPPERTPGHGRAPSGRSGRSPQNAAMHKHAGRPAASLTIAWVRNV